MEIRALLSAMSRGRTGPLLVAAQVALTLAVIVNVAYIVQQRLAIMNAPTGIDLVNTFWIEVQLDKPSEGFGSIVSADEQYLNSLPDVEVASISGPLPQTWNMIGLPFASEAALLQKPGAATGARVFMGSEKWLDAFGLKLVAGRNVSPEVVAPPAADFAATLANWPAETVVTKALADKLFPKGDALGKTMHVGLVNRPTTIVGIIGEFRGAPTGGAQGEAWAQQNVIVPAIPSGPTATYIVRTKPGRRDLVMGQLEQSFAERVPGHFLERIQTMERTARIARSGLRSSTIVLTTVAAIVALVTMLGIVGLAAFNVATRHKQLGTRRAIGADEVSHPALLRRGELADHHARVRRGVRARDCGGLKISQMYQLPRMPLYYLVAGVVGTWLLGLLAVVLPARRAASISPAIATRTV